MKVAVAHYSEGRGHATRMLAVAEELRARGHEVVIAGGGPGEQFVTLNGYDEAAITGVDFSNAGGFLSTAVEACHGLRRFVDFYRWLRREAPDRVVADDVFAAVAAAAARVDCCYVGHGSVPLFDRLPQKVATLFANAVLAVLAGERVVPCVPGADLPRPLGATAVPPVALDGAPGGDPADAPPGVPPDGGVPRPPGVWESSDAGTGNPTGGGDDGYSFGATGEGNPSGVTDDGNQSSATDDGNRSGAPGTANPSGVTGGGDPPGTSADGGPPPDDVGVLVVPSEYDSSFDEVASRLAAETDVTRVGGPDWRPRETLFPHLAAAETVVCSGYSTIMEAAVAGTSCVVVPQTTEQRGIARALSDLEGFETATSPEAVVEAVRSVGVPERTPNGATTVAALVEG